MSLNPTKKNEERLNRRLGIVGLTATGVCSMLGASVYVVPFMIQRNVPGIGPYVLYAFVFAALPCFFAALSYAILSSAMPRAGGSYIYASRGLHPYLGFISSFSQWFGLSIVIGVISYIIVPFIRDVAIALEWEQTAYLLDQGMYRVGIALILLWSFVYVNIRGAKTYERTLIPLMVVMFLLGGIVIISGFHFDQTDFIQALNNSGVDFKPSSSSTTLSWITFMSAAALLFSSYIGFDSIAQAGGEAKNPTSNLPLAIILALVTVGGYYMLFTAAVYHTVPWEFVAQEAINKDISAPGLLSYLLHPGIAVLIIAGAAIALINDLPAMLLSVSRMIFAWAEDRIFPDYLADVHSTFQTPYKAILASGVMATLGILGCHFAGDFFLGIDIMVTSMMVNFLIICITLITIPSVNSALHNQIKFVAKRSIQVFIGYSGTILLVLFLSVHTFKDLTSDVDSWYFRSTPIWLIVMALASVIYFYKMRIMKNEGVDIEDQFKSLPEN